MDETAEPLGTEDTLFLGALLFVLLRGYLIYINVKKRMKYNKSGQTQLQHYKEKQKRKERKG